MPGYMFSAREYGDMILMYGECHGNASAALRLDRERFPDRRHPADSRTITATYQRIIDNRPVVPSNIERAISPRLQR